MLANSSAKTSLALTPNWKITLLGVLLLPVLVKLGFWQLQRAEEKYMLLEHIHSQGQKPALLLHQSRFTPETLQHRRVAIEGQFLTGVYWLLDNRVFQGKVGYQVIAPLETTRGELFLINRGWYPAPSLRTELPQVDFPAEPVFVTGRWKEVSDHILVKDTQAFNAVDWPKRVQKIDRQRFEIQLEQPLTEGLVQISAEDPLALNVDWKPVNALPEKHQGYAVQWFTMSVTLVIALILANTNLATVISSHWRSDQKKTQHNDNKKGDDHECRAQS